MATQWYQAVHASKRYRLGTRKKDITGTEFVYGKGVASLAVGDFVLFNDDTFTPVRILNTAALSGIVAIAAAANILATTFSWYMVSGSTKNIPSLKTLVNIATSSVDKVPLSANSATAGRVTGDAVHAGLMIVGAWAIGVSAANVGDALLNYPSLEGTALA